MQVIFDEEPIPKSKPSNTNAGPIVKFIMKNSGGKIKTETAASQCLLVVAIVIFILSILVMRTLVVAPEAEPILSPYDV